MGHRADSGWEAGLGHGLGRGLGRATLRSVRSSRSLGERALTVLAFEGDNRAFPS